MSSDTSLTPSQLFAERLKQAMRDAGLPEKPSVLQARFNEHYDGDHVSWQTARNWLKGNFIPQHDKLRVIAEMLHVKPNYLLFDTPPPQSIKGNAADPAQPLSASPGDLSMWENYLGIEPEMQQVVRHVVSLMKNLQQLQEWKQTWEIGPIYVFFERFKKLLDDLDEFAKTGVTAPWKGVDIYSEDAIDQAAINQAMHESISLIAKAEKEVQELQQEWDVFFDSLIEKVEQQLKKDWDECFAGIFKYAAQQFKKNWNERFTTLTRTKLLEAEIQHKKAVFASSSSALRELYEKTLKAPPSEPSHRPPRRRM